MCICVVLVGVLVNDGNSMYMLVLLCSSFTSKMLVLFVLMAGGWWQDSGPIKLFLEQIGP